MAGQDWGGRRKVNPSGAPRVTRNDVLRFAQENGLTVRRDGLSNWWLLNDDGVWRTSGITNFLALSHLRRYLANRNDEPGHTFLQDDER